ncbi:restriction endonuclease subunit S [Enterococcus cecorum]|nr:restriction endonuclease subunit S [uncultured Enterococcus sp.]
MNTWKQQRLGNISIMYQPETITSSELHNSGYPVFGANGYIGYFSKYNHKTDQVIISARGEKTGTANFVQGPIWITGNSMVINLDNSGVNKYFLYSNIKSFSLKKYITGGAQPQLTRDVLMKVPIVIPKINEQNNISKIFIKLDNYITIHQRKLDQLKNLKQTLLNKMFI